MSEHDEERRNSPYGRRELDNFRFGQIEKRMDSIEHEQADLRDTLFNDRLAMRELVASLPHVYVPREEHDHDEQWAGQRLVIVAACITPLISLGGILVTILLNHH